MKPTSRPSGVSLLLLVGLGVGSQAGPMTYLSPRTGKQYVVVTAGGAPQSTDRGDYVIAYALPEGEQKD
ncbi:hypothetical protein [Pseudomonas sp.]|uniref:hypothetical protein n=1 Tax=Pseudomonas sp. TaxID=306 RepID=UPI0028A9DDCF|nr:hypothetical protein [Pseudomonas sp.]